MKKHYQTQEKKENAQDLIEKIANLIKEIDPNNGFDLDSLKKMVNERYNFLNNYANNINTVSSDMSVTDALKQRVAGIYKDETGFYDAAKDILIVNRAKNIFNYDSKINNQGKIETYIINGLFYTGMIEQMIKKGTPTDVLQKKLTEVTYLLRQEIQREDLPQIYHHGIKKLESVTKEKKNLQQRISYIINRVEKRIEELNPEMNKGIVGWFLEALTKNTALNATKKIYQEEKFRISEDISKKITEEKTISSYLSKIEKLAKAFPHPNRNRDNDISMSTFSSSPSP